MKKSQKILCAALTALICMFSAASFADGGEQTNAPDGLRSANLLLIDRSSSRVLYEKGSDEKIAPGGFTKILTAIVTLESVNDINEKVTADSKAVTTYDFSHNNMGVLPEEVLTVYDLLCGMIMYDAGEAANVLAVYTAQSQEQFAEKMNAKAAQIGCTSSSFTNPSGMDDEQQFSTLKDIALISEYAMTNETFAEIAAKKTYQIAPTNKYRQTRYLNNTNKFISKSASADYYTENATGMKTSYVSNSNCGLALTYTEGELSLMCLTAMSPYEGGLNYANEDAKKLIKYGTEYYVSEKILSSGDIAAEVKLRNGKEAGKVLLVAPEDLYINLPKDFDSKKLEKKIETVKKAKAPVNAGDALGQLTVLYNGEKYGTSILVADTTVTASPVKGFFGAIGAVFTSWIFIMAVIIIIALFIAYTILLNRAKRKKKFVSRFR